ncbi:MAG: hypothetical protein KDD47_08180 [Acidobacteria bacterium]|nr:hypothetical protein [Acidobacteriota bacterium]
MATAENSSKSRGCFKFGCIGCLGVIALLVGLPVLLALIGFFVGTPDPEFEQVDVTQPLPAGEVIEGNLEDPSTEVPLAPPGTAVPTEDLAGENRQVLDLGTEAVPPAGTIRLDLGLGEFTVQPAPPGEGVRIEGDYDRASFDLEESFTEQPDGTWEYAIELHQRVSWLRRFWSSQDVRNELTVYLPRHHPIALVGKMSTGKSELELGGLWLTEVELQLATGDHTLRFSEPTEKPLERLQLEGKFGEIDLVGIGNASPAWARLEGQFGEYRVDLGGAWRDDGEVDLQFQFGECRVRLPEGVRIEVERTSMAFGERRLELPEGQDALPDSAPTLSLRLEGSFGEMRVSP